MARVADSNPRARSSQERGSQEDWGAVLDALVAGDRVAFARFNRLLTSFLTQFRAYDFEHDWEDLRQEVLLSVVQSARAGRLREPGALVGYVRAIARNKFVDRLKRRLRCAERQTLPWEEEIGREPATGSFPSASPSLPREVRHDLREALCALGDRDRDLIERVYLRGETYEEASRASGVALGTLKRRLREGLGALRKRLEGGGGSL